MLRLETVMFNSKSSQNIFDMERILKKSSQVGVNLCYTST